MDLYCKTALRVSRLIWNCGVIVLPCMPTDPLGVSPPVVSQQGSIPYSAALLAHAADHHVCFCARCPTPVLYSATSLLTHNLSHGEHADEATAGPLLFRSFRHDGELVEEAAPTGTGWYVVRNAQRLHR